MRAVGADTPWWSPWCRYAVFLLLSGCATAAAPRASADARERGLRSTDSDQSPAFRARISLGVTPAGFGDNWVDLEVSNQKEPGRTICEALAETELRQLANAGVQARVERPCSEAPLPAVPLGPGDHILIDERAISEAELLLAAPQLADELRNIGKSRRTAVTRFPSEERCQQMLARLAAARAQEQRAGDEAARTWLDQQVTVQKRDVEQACAQAGVVESRCAALPTRADVEQACKQSKKAERCAEAEQAYSRTECEIERARTRQQCANSSAMLELLTRRRDAARPIDDAARPIDANEAPAPVCR